MQRRKAAPRRAAILRTASTPKSTEVARAFQFLCRRGLDPVVAASTAPDLAAEAEKVRREQERHRGVDYAIRQRPHQESRGGGQQTLCGCGKWMNPESVVSTARHRLCADLAATA